MVGYLVYNNKMKRKIKFIYFDAGGVLFRWRESFDFLAKKFRKNKDEILHVYEKHEELSLRGKMTTYKLWSQILKELKIPENEHDDFSISSVRNFIPILETHDLIKKIGKNFPIGILSNAHNGLIELSHKYGHIPKHKFRVVIESCKIGLIKPEKEIYEHARKLTGVAHENILFIDDLEINISAARKLGWQGIVFDTDNPRKSVSEINKMLGIDYPLVI